MQSSYYLSKNGTHVGPFSLEDICKKLESREHTWMDYVYDDKKEDWILLIEHPVFSEKFNTTFIKKLDIPSTPKKNLDPLLEKAWYTLKNGVNFGPFSQLELVQMLQEKTLFEYDYIWHQSLPSWKRVAEVPAFSADKIKHLKESHQSEISEIFFRRRHLRANYGCSIIVHDNKSVFKGESIEISAGGAGIRIENKDINPGQTLFLHFQPGEGVPPFNAVCNIVSKQLVTEENSINKTVKYGVKFTSVSQNIREQIKEFTETRKAS